MSVRMTEAQEHLISAIVVEVFEEEAITAHELREAALAVEIGEPRPDLATKLRRLACGFDNGRSK